MRFHVTSFQGCWLQARINPRRLFTVLPFSAVVDSRWGSTKEYVVLLISFCRSLTPDEDRPSATDPFPFHQWHVTFHHHSICFFSILSFKLFSWSCWSLMTTPCHIILTILHTCRLLTPSSANLKKEMQVCCNNRGTHTASPFDAEWPKTSDEATYTLATQDSLQRMTIHLYTCVLRVHHHCFPFTSG